MRGEIEGGEREGRRGPTDNMGELSPSSTCKWRVVFLSSAEIKKERGREINERCMPA